MHGVHASPLYRQVEEDLFDRIYRGEFLLGDALPTEDALIRHYDVSRITVRRALDELARRGVVVRRQGRGTFVRDSTTSIRSVVLRGYLDDIIAFNRHEFVGRQRVAADQRVAGTLVLENGVEVDEVKAINVFDNTRFAFVIFHIPQHFASLLADTDFVGRSAPVRLIEARSGIRVQGAEQTIDPWLTDAETAEHLGLDVGQPILRVTRVYVGQGQIPLEMVTIFYHPDRYRISVELEPFMTPFVDPSHPTRGLAAARDRTK